MYFSIIRNLFQSNSYYILVQYLLYLYQIRTIFQCNTYCISAQYVLFFSTIRSLFQCNPILDKSFVSVVKHLSLSCQGADALRCRLDVVSSSFERDERRMATIYQSTFDEMKGLCPSMTGQACSITRLLTVLFEFIHFKSYSII